MIVDAPPRYKKKSRPTPILSTKYSDTHASLKEIVDIIISYPVLLKLILFSGVRENRRGLC